MRAQVSKEQFDKILHMCKQGEEQGAKLECGGKRLGDKGYYIEPTVFSNVQDDNIIATDEIFGPVQSILKWKTVEEVRLTMSCHVCLSVCPSVRPSVRPSVCLSVCLWQCNGLRVGWWVMMELTPGCVESPK